MSVEPIKKASSQQRQIDEGFPQLVMRLFPGIYPRFPIELTQGELAEAPIHIYGCVFSLRRPGAYRADACLDCPRRREAGLLEIGRADNTPVIGLGG